MTCQECQPLAIDLARGLPPFDVGGAVQRADVLSHVGTCKRCAQWLREQEALSDALRVVAAAHASLAAPPGVEASVMAAFRARQAQRQQTPQPQRQQPLALAHAAAHADTESLVPIANADRAPNADRAARRIIAFTPGAPVVREHSSPAGTWRPAWPAGRAAGFAAAAAAAIVFTTLMLPVSQWLKARPASNGGATNVAGASAPLSSTPLASQPSSSPVTGTNAAVIEVLPDKGRKTTKGRPAPPPVTPRPVASSRGATARGLAAHSARPVNVARGASEFSGPAFVLLPYAEPLRPTEMRHIMRVRMTKTQYAAAELQAGGEDDATVLADVLVGEDGTARAVRIVQ